MSIDQLHDFLLHPLGWWLTTALICMLIARPTIACLERALSGPDPEEDSPRATNPQEARGELTNPEQTEQIR